MKEQMDALYVIRIYNTDKETEKDKCHGEDICKSCLS